LSGGVIAGLAVVGAIILAIIALVIWGLIMRRKARANMRTDGVLPKSGGVGVTWSNVGYEVKPTHSGSWGRVAAWFKGSGKVSNTGEAGENVGPNGGKIVLRDVCGQLPAGGFCAILGPSGAGKSTLVDVLAGKRKAGKVEGKVGFTRAGQERVKIGYVDQVSPLTLLISALYVDIQSDVLSPTATVLETLYFAAQLRLPENIPKGIKQDRAITVLTQLGLTDVAHTRVGSIERRGISGGEMRRVSIGIELVAAPDVIVLDEPTSGLDSVSASRLIKLLKSLTEAENRTTIIASIHQPSSALYHSFSQICLLSNGRQLYFGPGGSKPAEYFEKQGRPCPEGYNVADHLLEIASGSSEGLKTGKQASNTGSMGSSVSNSNSEHLKENSNTNSESRFVEEDMSPSHEKDIQYPPASLLMDEGKREVDLSDLSEEKQKKEWWPRSYCATTFLTQMTVLSGREWRNLKR
jgi:ABC-type multidrug transport system ATPase subunit